MGHNRRVEAVAAARSFVAERYPTAKVAILGGSAVNASRTSTSDLDILVITDEPNDAVETVEFEGWIVEAFVYGPAQFDSWVRRVRDERRPTLIRIAADGVGLFGTEGASGFQEAMRAMLGQGPAALTEGERDARRYDLSAELDDLREARSVGEGFVLASSVFMKAAEFALLHHQRWVGTGKWLMRELHAAGDVPPAARLAEWASDADRSIDQLIAVAEDVLDEAGGYLQVGHLRGTLAAE
jgi:predicted nucleotidyltransferase